MSENIRFGWSPVEDALVPEYARSRGVIDVVVHSRRQSQCPYIPELISPSNRVIVQDTNRSDVPSAQEGRKSYQIGMHGTPNKQIVHHSFRWFMLFETN